MDGDKTTIFHDIDGSISEYPGAFLVKEDNWLLRHPDCIDVPDWRAAICSGRYAQVCKQSSNSLNISSHKSALTSTNLLSITPSLALVDYMSFHIPIKVL